MGHRALRCWPVPSRPPDQARPDARLPGAGDRGDLLDSLETTHEAGLVHGDVRPANIRLQRNRWVLLPGTGTLAWANFAGPRDEEVTLAASGYSAPEVVRGESPTQSSDLFSLGATLYHLVAGHAPPGQPRRDPCGRAAWPRSRHSGPRIR
ncbi:protein kinase domain-containing protein [Streptomyces collinus]|uniref:protein kinase domain-containing protein n=1 Tax=Streptomyces collinus TaxID=42684 RepID=UPI00332E5554